MGEDGSYNGWTNHATWCVNLHLANDAPLQREVLAITAEVLYDPPFPRQSEYWSVEQAARYAVADAIKDYVEQITDPAYAVSRIVHAEYHVTSEPMLLVWDLIGAYLVEVNCDEIADAWISQVAEEANYSS